MNTLQEESSSPVPDSHAHQCMKCGMTITHTKSDIAPGCGPVCHTCPGCGDPLNVRMTLDEMHSFGIKPDVKGWYGPDDVGKKVSEKKADSQRRKRHAK